MKVISKRLKDFDKIGEEFNLKFQGRDRFSTLYGGFFSGILIVISYFVFLKLMSDYIRQDDPDIRQNSKVASEPPLINLYENNFAYAFSLYSEDKNNSFAKDFSKNFDLTLKIITLNDTESLTPSNELKIQYAPCSLLKDRISRQFIELSNDNYMKERGLCMSLTKPEEYYLNASLLARPFTISVIELTPCTQNITDPTNKCAPFYDFLINVGIIAHKMQVTFDPSNKKKPTSYYIDSDEIYSVDITSSLQIIHFIRKTEIFNDDIDFYGSYLTESYVEVDSSTSSRVYRDYQQTVCTESNPKCYNYLKMTLRSSSQSLQITREYKFLVTTLSDLGGFFDIMVMVTALAFGYCNTRSYKAYIREDFMRLNSINYSELLEGTDDSTIYRFMDEVIQDTQNGLTFYKQSARQQFIDRILFQEHHSVLIPLILILEKKIKEKKESEIMNASRNGDDQVMGKNGAKPHKNILNSKRIMRNNKVAPQDPQNPLISKKSIFSFDFLNQNSPNQPNQQQMSVDQAIEKLRSNKSKSSLGQMIDSYMIKILQEGLEKPIIQDIVQSKFDRKSTNKLTRNTTYKFNKARKVTLSKFVVDQEMKVKEKPHTFQDLDQIDLDIKGESKGTTNDNINA